MEIEFSGLRSSYFKESMREFPKARDEELRLALHYLQPQKGESILEVGAGSGFFTEAIAESVSPSILIASDPSFQQLESISHLKSTNLSLIVAGGDCLPLDHPCLKASSFDAIWSGGSFHHVNNKSDAFKRFYALLKPGGRLVISDVFAGSATARHFDLEVAKYCATGHEVSFLSKEFADTLCHLAGFNQLEFFDEIIHWKFQNKQDIGTFLYKIHAMIKTTPEKCLEKAEQILGIDFKKGLYCLNWPLTVLVSYKNP